MYNMSVLIYGIILLRNLRGFIMDKVCKNCGCTEFAMFDGHHECVYCGEILEDTVVEIQPINTVSEDVKDVGLVEEANEVEEVPDIFDDNEFDMNEEESIEDEVMDSAEIITTIEDETVDVTEEVLSCDDSQTKFLSEDIALDYFKEGKLSQGYEMMDSLSETTSGPYKNLTYYYIGKCFEIGEGVSVDAERAKYFYGLAETNELLGSESELGEVSYLLAMMYMKGGFFAIDEIKAFKLFETSARFNYDKGIYNCALCYKLGKGVLKDDFKAFELFNKCALCDYPLAYFQIGKAFENGTGVTKDVNRAIDSYHVAADKGAAIAMGALGNIYYYGIEGVSDYNKAFYWYEKGAELGDSNCQYNLAQCYYNGIACAQNVVKALELLKEAGNSGNKNALALEKEIRLKYLSI